ncbi:MAG: class I SAM-dependent methyltransferase [Desulfurellaceae bacterium]|nr:class I SAM-dependent methyltransferase [Desulfurellaceae bacterium]
MDDTQRAVFNDRQRQAFDKSYTYFLVPLPQDVIDRMGRIIAAATIRAGETVLDVGTGTGALIPQIRTYRPGRIIACDLSANMLAQVAERYPEVERHQSDIADLSLPAECVDVVFMNGMYGNIADKSRALGTIVRMLRPGGRVVISHPEGRAYVERLVKTDPYPITPLPSHEEARTFLGSFGLRVGHYTDEERLLIVVAAKADIQE